ncbi:DUF4314 domain-containing protein [Enterococcus rivorum]|uniref:DUF4314 domain-containing protein n=1 Tax=Enterococcus rivorum TaxID=762845 RepID=A0A1E5L0F3_9ENTE|nr:DUF4314 domain-containing protein [Enterococcus rivorum]MBP2098834.1 hypothetical protein [Enterococcus rivorum]OEH83565.1 hypothetical protein BCR26_08785 [Enterococcus rivorum]
MIDFTLVAKLKEQYPTGTRVQLIEMSDPYPVPPLTLGTIRLVDDIGQIHVRWDNGRTLPLNVVEDHFKTIK